MDCKAIEREIFRFIYGEGDADRLRRIKAHLDVCGHCARERDIITGILAQLKDGYPDDPVPAGLRERVLASIRIAVDG
jgi:mycothiol system anti-sigma-R factor